MACFQAWPRSSGSCVDHDDAKWRNLADPGLRTCADGAARECPTPLRILGGLRGMLVFPTQGQKEEKVERIRYCRVFSPTAITKGRLNAHSYCRHRIGSVRIGYRGRSGTCP